MKTFRSIASINIEKIAAEIDADFETIGINEYDFTETTNDQQELFVPELIQPIQQIVYKMYNDNDFFFAIDPRRFEEVVAELLHKQGFLVDLTKQTGDGGYDIIALSMKGNLEFKTLVEWKRHSKKRKIGIGIIRSFCDVLNTENANKGMIVTTSTFSKPSIERSNEMGYKLDLIDRVDLLNWTSDYLNKSKWIKIEGYLNQI